MSKGTQTTFGYYVEARTVGVGRLAAPIRVGATYLDREWQQIEFSRSQQGVRSDTHDLVADRHGVLSYEAACALMSWEAANLPWLSTEFRLVQVEVKSTWEITEKGVGRTVNFLAKMRAEEFTARPSPGGASTEGDET